MNVVDASSTLHTAAKTATYTVVNDVSVPPDAVDSVPPAPPTGLSASAKNKQNKLAWTASTDNVGVTGYQVWRNDALLVKTIDTSYIDRTVSKGDYTYFVKAEDAAGNRNNFV